MSNLYDDGYDSHFLTQLLNFPVYFQDSTSSTQVWAKSFVATNTPINPILFITNHQTAGTGRFGRHFFSPANSGIYATLLLPKKIFNNTANLITPCIAASLLEGIYQTTGLSPGIKWVNDLYLDDKKIAGILTESYGHYWIIGMGLNVYPTTLPNDLRAKVGSLYSPRSTIYPATRQAILQESIITFFTTDTAALMTRYKETSILINKMITFYENGILLKAHAIAIGPSGELLVELVDTRQKKSLTSGEVSLITWEEDAKP